MSTNVLERFSSEAQASLYRADSELHGLLSEELSRQHSTLALVASCSIADISVLACEGAFLDNVTAEGYPGARYHAGCEVIDKIERLAIERARQVFGAQYANVQPLSASIANQIVIASLLQPGDTLLGMDLDAGGHLSHGSRVNVSGKHFNSIPYGVGKNGYIDYDAVRELALQHRPKLIIAGTTAYPRTLDFSRFRDIADEVGAFLLADITHIAGLVAAGEHPSPVDIAHVTTMCTHKQLYGPRGGLILCGKDHAVTVNDSGMTLTEKLDRGVFPLYQGAPAVNKIAAKARALGRAATPEFRDLAHDIRELARAAAETLEYLGARVMFGGTDNHIVIIDVLTTFGITGIVAQRSLEECGIIVNKNRIVNDTKPVTVASGIRIGTNSAAARRMTAEAMSDICHTIVSVLRRVDSSGDREYVLNSSERQVARQEVQKICDKFPLPGYVR
ncbi:serine hydroxymethyltransferase [Burkholderia stabilis]|uniref:serine hydroxymethyltransferase n=1 Tax=Burkholderia cepacia complex TaxID=87882 RepID=UPI00075441E0|nr:MULTISPECIES: serine hydroxymethyltransferase [Burkholderia cepacia complex]AOR73114.1 serine hydroxymethyltransferase [Burkholderia stabilis]KVK90918.1 serine hydroxymethyltransferase [Burkholderia cepacia]HDR9489946.1 serine hydroxymethyltransferase [Burkholderia stabilis]HDR9526414.1 serine hydroxymethyltransferase [Burkholderia stabilis]HDR9537051.1 serine hydroxymethyltransferase [Burkholderia stabilis]